MMRFLSPTSKAGLTVVEVLVAMGLVGIIAVMGSQIASTVQAASEGGEAMGEAMTLKHSLLMGLDCQRTLFAPVNNGYDVVPAPSTAHPACSESIGNNYFELISLIPGPMNSASYPQLTAFIGKFDPNSPKAAAPYLKKIYARASCIPCPICTGGLTIKVEYKSRRSEKAGWTDLFRGVPFACIGP